MATQIQAQLFLDSVNAFTIPIVQRRVKELQSELVKSLNATPGSADDQAIDMACRNLNQKIKAYFEKNLSKFEIYAKRNIFVSTPTAAGSSSSSSSSSARLATVDATALSVQLKSRLVELHQIRCDRLHSRHQAQGLLTDLRTAVYQYRVGLQALDEHQVRPLGEFMANLEQQRLALIALSQRANDLSDYLNSISAPLCDPKPEVSEIRTGTAADMHHLTRAILEK